MSFEITVPVEVSSPLTRPQASGVDVTETAEGFMVRWKQAPGPLVASVMVSPAWRLGTHNYVEIELHDLKNSFGLGLATSSFPLVDRMIGWEEDSIGLHSDDGKLFISGTEGKDYCPSFHKVGRRAGVGLDPQGRVYFTLDGALVDSPATLAANGSPPHVVISYNEKAKMPGVATCKIIADPASWLCKTQPQFPDPNAKGQVATWGAGNQHKLGHGLTRDEELPVILKTLKSIVKVSCGHDHTLALDDTGQVFAWGSNSFGQVGSGAAPLASSPTLIQFPQNERTKLPPRIVSVAAGYRHSLALDSEGVAYSWGDGLHGCLGAGSVQVRFVPGVIPFSSPIAKVAAGHYTSAFLTKTGQVSLFGAWSQGTLQSRFWTPQAAWTGSWKFVDLAISDNSGLALNAAGQLFKWTGTSVPSPLLPDTKFSHIACAPNHYAAVSLDCRLFTWNFGQLDKPASPQSPTSNSTEPLLALTWHKSEPNLQIVPLPFTPVQLEANWKSVMLLSEEGEAYLYGQGSTVSRLTGAEGLRQLHAFTGTVTTALSAGPEHAALIFEEAAERWDFAKELLSLVGWQAIGTGRFAPKKVKLTAPSFLETAGTKEYSFAADLFFKQLNGAQFEIQELWCVENQSLESAFHTEIEKLTNKWRDFPHLFRSQDWRTEQDAETKTKVLSSLEQYAKTLAWNQRSQVPIVPVIHCTSDDAVWPIMSAGFSVLSTRDDGRFGRGIYFTTDASYAASYAKDEECTFVVGLALPGNAYPVTKEMLGQPQRRGYQSHYVQLSDGQPGLGRADELVLFQENQVLPRYVIRARRTGSSGSASLSGALPFEIPKSISAQKFRPFLEQVSQWLSQQPKLEYSTKRELAQTIASAEQWLSVNPLSRNVPPAFAKLRRALEAIAKDPPPPQTNTAPPTSPLPSQPKLEPTQPILSDSATVLLLQAEIDSLRKELQLQYSKSNHPQSTPQRPLARPKKQPLNTTVKKRANGVLWDSSGLWLPGLNTS